MLGVNGPEGITPLAEEQKLQIGMSYVRQIEMAYEFHYGALPDYGLPETFENLSHIVSLLDIEARTQKQSAYGPVEQTGLSRYSIASLLAREAFQRESFFDQFGPCKQEALDTFVGILNYEGGSLERAKRLSGLETLKEKGLLTNDRISEFYELVSEMHQASLISTRRNYELINSKLGDAFLNTFAALIEPIHYTRQTGEEFYEFFHEFLRSA